MIGEYARQRSKGPYIAASFVLLTLGATLFALWRISPIGRGSAQVEDELARLRALGVVTDATQMKPAKPVPDALNAALIYAKASEKFKKVMAGKPNIIGQLFFVYKQDTVSPSEESLARERVHSLQPVFDLVEQAANLPYMDWKRDWGRGRNVLFPDYGYAGMIVRALIVKAYVLDHDGRTLDALDAIETAARMAHQIGQEPDMIGAFMRKAMFKNASFFLEHVLKEHGRDRKVLTRARKAVQDFGPPADLKPALGFEVVSTRLVAETYSNSDLSQIMQNGFYSGPSSKKPMAKFASYKMVRHVYEAKALQVLRELVEKLPVDPNDYRQTLSAFKSVKEEVLRQKDWSYDLFKGMFVDFGELGKGIADYEARRRLMLCVIDALEYTALHGRYPDKLVSKGRDSIDPFSGKPLAYVRYVDSFMIYSFGPNGIDDCGDPVGATWTTAATDDIPYTYP